MGAVCGKALGAVDDQKIAMAIDKGFDFFDKNHDGTIDAAETRAAAEKALGLVGPLGKKVTPQMIDGAFVKAAGADQKMDKQEFARLVHGLLAKVGYKGGAAHGTAAAPGAAPAAAAAAAH